MFLVSVHLIAVRLSYKKGKRRKIKPNRNFKLALSLQIAELFFLKKMRFKREPESVSSKLKRAKI